MKERGIIAKFERHKDSDVSSVAFGKTLRRLRYRAGLSQEELAKMTGIDRTYPSLLERGLRGPTLIIMLALCGPLQIRLNDMVDQFKLDLRIEMKLRKLRAVTSGKVYQSVLEAA